MAIPAPETLARALEELTYLGAIFDEGLITLVGKEGGREGEVWGGSLILPHERAAPASEPWT